MSLLSQGHKKKANFLPQLNKTWGLLDEYGPSIWNPEIMALQIKLKMGSIAFQSEALLLPCTFLLAPSQNPD